MNYKVISLYIFILFFLKLVYGDIITLPILKTPLKSPQRDSNSRFLDGSTNSFDIKLNFLDEPAFTVEISLGKSETSLNLIVDTGFSELWVSSDTCAECQGKVENTYNCDQSDDCVVDTNSKEESLQYGDGVKVTGQIARTPMKIGELVIEKQPFLFVTKGEKMVSGFDGMMGLGLFDRYDENKKNWIQKLFEQKKITKQSFSMYFGFDNDSTLTVGGFNQDLIKDSKPITYHTVTGDQHWSLSSSKVTFGDVSTQGGAKIEIILDTGASNLLLPTALYQQIVSFLKTKFQLEILPDKGNDKLCEIANQLPDLVFNILDESNNDVSYSLSYKDYIFKNKGECMFGIIGIPDTAKAVGDIIFLGTTFHLKYLVVYEYSPNRIGLVESISEPKSLESDDSISNHSKKLLFWDSLYQYIIILYLIITSIIYSQL